MIIVSACLAGFSCRYDGGSNQVKLIAKLVKEGKAVAVCPEELGGMSTPREPAEIVRGSGNDLLSGIAIVKNRSGQDVSREFIHGALETWEIAKRHHACVAILKERSPSCGSTQIYDGTFNGQKKAGRGVTAALLHEHGIEVLSEDNFMLYFRNSDISNLHMLMEGHPMEQFENVTVVKKANIYFDGKVTSRTVVFSDGEKKTLGIMMPGEYEFATADKEQMEIMAGDLEVMLPDSQEWKQIIGGQSFEVPANASFKLKVKEVTDYCCSYIKESK